MSYGTLLVAATVLATGAAASAVAQRPDTALVGEWTGTAQISVDWCLQRELPVHVTIREDGVVTGQIGDATLHDGRIRPNRSRIARAMKLGTDWVIEAGLVGPIVQHEAVVRETIRVPLNRTGSTLTGELATSGSYEPMRDDMVLTATGLVLRRAGGTSTPTPR